MKNIKRCLLLCFLIILIFASGSTILAAKDTKKTDSNNSEEATESHYKYVALTFDDGPSEYMAEFLNGLADRNAKVTFFICGSYVEDYGAVVELAEQQGHEIGNHSWSHPDYTELSIEEVKTELDKTDSLIEKITGQTKILSRPPCGFYDDEILDVMECPAIGWSIDTYDWSIKDAEDLTKRISAAKDGDIVLCHISVESTPKGALDAIDKLQKKGYRFVTVSELAKIKGKKLKSGKYYYSFKGDTVEDYEPYDIYSYDESKIEKYWAYDELKTLAEEECLPVTKNGKYMPEAAIKRSDAALALYRMFGNNEIPGDITLNDVSKKSVTNVPVRWCVENGYMDVDEDNNFYPDNDLTRQELCYILYSIAEDYGVNMNTDVEFDYNDAPIVDKKAVDGMKACIKAGFLSGRDSYDNGKALDPGKYITRGEFAYMTVAFRDYCEKYIYCIAKINAVRLMLAFSS